MINKNRVTSEEKIINIILDLCELQDNISVITKKLVSYLADILNQEPKTTVSKIQSSEPEEKKSREKDSIN